MQQFTDNPVSSEEMTYLPNTRKYVGSGEDCCLNYAELNNLTLEEAPGIKYWSSPHAGSQSNQ